MTVPVVDALEMINVEHRERIRLVEADGAAVLRGQVPVEAAAVMQPVSASMRASASSRA